MSPLFSMLFRLVIELSSFHLIVASAGVGGGVHLKACNLSVSESPPSLW